MLTDNLIINFGVVSNALECKNNNMNKRQIKSFSIGVLFTLITILLHHFLGFEVTVLSYLAIIMGYQVIRQIEE